MSLPIEELTPRQIVAELDRYIVGQAAAKRAIAVALRNRYRRQQLPAEEREDVLPKNILMIGPTGVGKTELARRLAQMARAPFIKVEATKFTEVGYVGRDVESMVRDLAAAAVRLVEREKLEAARPQAEGAAFERIAELLEAETVPRRRAPAPSAWAENPLIRQAYEVFGKASIELPTEESEPEEDDRVAERRKKRLIRELRAGKHRDRMVEIDVEEQTNPFVQVFTPQGMEEMGLDIGNLGPSMNSRRSTSRRMRVGEAIELLIEQEARHSFDAASLNREAVQRAEQTGMIFLDELDKVAGKGSGGHGPDVSREGVQRDLLPIIEGSTVASKFGPIKTDHILFIAAGAFHTSRPSDLIPELQGRLPIRVELDTLGLDDFRKILSEPKNALIKQYQKLLEVDGLSLSFSEDALDAIADLAVQVNERTENIGARRLHTLLEKLLEDLLFEAPSTELRKVNFDGNAVREKLGKLVTDADLSRYIL